MQPSEGAAAFNTSLEIGMNCTCYPPCSETIYDLAPIVVKREPKIHSML